MSTRSVLAFLFTMVLPILMVRKYDTTVVEARPFCAEPEEECSPFRPCCGREWVCSRQFADYGACVRCAPTNGSCRHANDCCLGVCLEGQCRELILVE
ncbi:unnamed protein product [Calicophoron daubneyi]|uniref:Uncharacterized protein n=1 Tax=Calicophoron daubneyi TaxID=300641 RepID=A0AAV2SXW6_CALDB